ncbi:MAG: recombination mediator RecR [Parachlamydia sp.]|jgi:recombination protein RecR|nr:recombination mediator RecR [Parachlamydia sp.]
MRYPEHLLKLILLLKKLPGVGNKSAERFAFHLLNWPQEHLGEFGEAIRTTKEKLMPCTVCGCLKGEEACYFCDTAKRDTSLICVIATPKDLFSIEETHEYRGLYHVLGGVLSPLDGRGPSDLSVAELKQRIESLDIKEVIIALDSTLEGDATSLYLKQELGALPVQISRLAFGIPMGSALDYVDGGTLARAFAGRLTY